MNQGDIQKFFSVLSEKNPHPETELYYKNNFTLLIAVVLSAQATDKGVNKVTKEKGLFEKINGPQDVLDMGKETFLDYVKSIGLYRTKAENIFKLCHILLEKHHGDVPSSRDELEALPGVGRKTANVVLNIAFGHSTIAVDTHIFRVANRTGLATGKTPIEVEKKLCKVIPEMYKVDAHHWLILHGRYICKARKPLCNECSVSRYCDFFKSQFP